MANSHQGVRPISWPVDALIVLLLLASLVGAWQIRQGILFATTPVSIQGLNLAIPANSIPLRGEDTYAVVTPDGIIVRVNTLPVPPIGLDDGVALATSRALTRAPLHDVYQTLSTEILTVDGRYAGLLEYAYVDSDNESFFASSLQIIRGYDLLVGEGENLYVLTVEGPERKSADVDSLRWRLQESLDVVGGDS